MRTSKLLVTLISRTSVRSRVCQRLLCGQIVECNAAVQQISQKQPFEIAKMATIQSGHSLRECRKSHMRTKQPDADAANFAGVYRAEPEVLDGSWSFTSAEPAK